MEKSKVAPTGDGSVGPGAVSSHAWERLTLASRTRYLARTCLGTLHRRARKRAGVEDLLYVAFGFVC